MMSGMYAAISGLQAHQTMLDVTGNNLANVDTIGYKAQSTTFTDELSQLVRPGSAPSATAGGTNPLQIGLGVQVGSIDNVMGAGSLETTGNATDVAIQGDGFLVVQAGGTSNATPPVWTASSPSLQYTRAGNLSLTPDSAGNTYLTTSSGQYVLGYAKAGATGAPTTPIEIPAAATNVAIATNGAVTYTDGNPADNGQNGAPNTYNTTVTAGYIGLATMANEAGMQRDGGSLWSTTSNSGTPTYGQPGTGNIGQTISGQLEMSNVDMATEFTNMIEAQRGYQANAQTITTADQMLQTVVQMKQ